MPAELHDGNNSRLLKNVINFVTLRFQNWDWIQDWQSIVVYYIGIIYHEYSLLITTPLSNNTFILTVWFLLYLFWQIDAYIRQVPSCRQTVCQFHSWGVTLCGYGQCYRTFQKYRLPPSSGLRYVRWLIFCMYVYILFPQIPFQTEEQLQLHKGYPPPRASSLLTHVPCQGSSALQDISYMLLPSYPHHYLPQSTALKAR
jgi:hypothetical protein